MSPTPESGSAADRVARWGIVLAAAAAVLLSPVPDGIRPASWRLLAIFFATIVASIAQPAPIGAVILLALGAAMISGAMTPAETFRGYADPIVWLVLCAFMISNAVTKTGLGRRLAFICIRAIGGRSLGLAYALIASDTLLASAVPSNAARAGGVVFPIARSVAEAYESLPGPTRRRLGAFLMKVVYQGDVVACAMFLTGQASNVIIAKFALGTAGVDLTYTRWLIGGLVPGIVSLLVVVYVVYRIYPPEIKHTPQAAILAQDALAAMGPVSRNERIMLAVFVLILALWITSSLHHIHYTAVAIFGVGMLLLSNVLAWDDVLGDRTAWNTFVWYGGLINMAEALGAGGVTQRFAEWSVSMTSGWTWGAALIVLLLVYFYSHYVFASITAHVTAMFVPFLAVMLAARAPAGLAAVALAYASNLQACLTHYGTTPAPIYFGAGYVTQPEWWRVGFIVSIVTLTIWGTVGLAWWKWLGWW